MPLATESVHVRVHVKGDEILGINFLLLFYCFGPRTGHRNSYLERHLPIGLTLRIDAAGGHSITADMEQEWPEISMETVIARAPEALLLYRNGEVNINVLRTLPGWNVLPAVRSQRVYYTDLRIDFASPIAIEALEDLARQFHP